MKLYFLRHGLAVERGTPGFRADSERPLTPKGEREMKRIAAGIRALDLAPKAILSSPYARAWRTAEIVAATLDTLEDLKLSKNLAADADPAALVDELTTDFAACESMMLVGHEPYLSALISLLVSGGLSAGIALRKGGLCKLQIEGAVKPARCAKLEWLLTPKQLCQIG